MADGNSQPRIIREPIVRTSLDQSAPLSERLRLRRERAHKAVAEPYHGITTDGTVRTGLFPIRRTGISLEPIVDAADAFLASLEKGTRALASFALESDEWRAWLNIHPNVMRHGLCLQFCSDEQRALALAIVRASMSASGYGLATDVMNLNDYLGEISGRIGEFGRWYYWISVFGTPSVTEPWGWQIDGHHLIVNCFVLGDQLVLTPNFMGSEPVAATSGPFAGTRVFAAEEAAGFALMRALTPEQRARATIGTTLPVDVFGTASADNLVLPRAGIGYDELTPEQQRLLLQAIEPYVGRIRDGHAEIRRDEVRAHLDETWFAWIGEFGDGKTFYYRIQSPVILIEFDHQPGVVFDNTTPSYNHIHTAVRTPNGNDYGKDLLRAHYERHDHSHAGTAHRRGIE